jgi:hypothetical protein
LNRTPVTLSHICRAALAHFRDYKDSLFPVSPYCTAFLSFI